MDEAQPTTAPQPSSQPASPHVHSGSVKETLESILVAFILAFIFRAFIVEAFVIPTGSMAPTLMGAHMRFTCPDCGYNFDVDYRGIGEGDDVNIPSNAGPVHFPVYCPNCGFQMGTDQLSNPPVYYGDRILVQKYLYLFEQPHRWDVVVFKAPVSPDKYNYSQNYIKRLVAKPNEAIMVLDGDVYIRSPQAKDPDDFVVQTKPKHVQDALWRLVYDNDYHPEQKLDRGSVYSWKQPWTSATGSGWKLDDQPTHGREFVFDNLTGAGTLFFEPKANPTAQSVSEYLAYDQDVKSRDPEGRFAANDFPVSDLDLRMVYQRTSGGGPLTLTMTKRDYTFIAIITPTTAELLKEVNHKRTSIGQSLIRSSSRPMRIEFSNADYQVMLRINDDIAVQTTPADYAPNLTALKYEYNQHIKSPPPRLEISAEQQTARLSHLSLWRDVYYYNGPPVAVRWATPDHPQQLNADEYFVMGDNSLVSLDARCWQQGGDQSAPPIDLPDEDLYAEEGRVPGRFLMGKAFFVYWPAGYHPVTGWPAFVPNFGDMRFIH